MRLYLDLETYRPRVEEAFAQEKIIAIGVLEDRTPYSPDSSKMDESHVKLHYFNEWDLGGESKVVSEFYNYLNDLVSSKYTVVVVGFNILRFDIPLLIQKGVEYNVGNLSELNKLWHNTFAIDYFQTTLPFHDMKFKGMKLEHLVEKAKSKGIDIPEPLGSGKDVKDWYEKKKYDDIIGHLEKDLKVIRTIDLNHRHIYFSDA